MKPIYNYLGAAVVGLFIGYCTYRSAPLAMGGFAAAVALNQLDLLAKLNDLKKSVEELKTGAANSPGSIT